MKIDTSNRFIKSILDAESEAIMVLGSRKAESAVRKAVLEGYEKKRYRAHLSPNGSFPNSYVFTPIENWLNDNVWQYLVQVPNPWGHSNKDLLAMYSGASADGECPLVIDSSTPSCGNSRFGCWVCTMVTEDKSMAAMIQNDEEKAWMLPMLEFRISVTMAAQSGGWGGKTGLYFVDLCNGNPKLTDHARCIKAKYNSGITNRGGDNSGVLISPAGMDKDAVLSFVDICTGKAKLTREARCILSAYNRTISNWGGSSGVFYGCRAVVTPDREEKRQNGRRIKNCGEPSFTVTAQDRHGVLFQDCDECPYGMQIREATKKGYDIARCGDSINLSFPESKTRRGRVGKDLATTLETSCNQGTAFAGCGLIRRLTPRECWRLQGFTDEMFDKARAVNSDNQLYRQAGNSVTVPVIYAIGKQILAAQKALECGE